MKKIYIASFVVTLAIFGSYFFPKNQTVVQQLQSFGAVGDTNSTSRIAQCSLDLSTTTSSTISGTGCLLNGDGRDRIITSIDIYGSSLTTSTSNGTGVKNLTWNVATSTGVYTPDGTKVLSTSVSTTTPILYVSSTTPGTIGIAATNDYARTWATGTYLNVLQNATSTASGIIVVRYIVAP